MAEPFKSSALEANLAQTKLQDTRLSEKQQWFLTLSKPYWGVHQRVLDFFKEYNHPYPDYKGLFDGLHSISVSDLWVYMGTEKKEDALLFIVSMYSELLQRELDSNWMEELIKSLCKFTAALGEEEDVPDSAVRASLGMLEYCVRAYPDTVIRNSGLFRTYLGEWGIRPRYQEDVCQLVRRVLIETCQYWADTSKAEEWYRDHASLFHPSAKKQIRLIGGTFFAELQKRIDQATNWDQISRCLFFGDIAHHFRRITDEFQDSSEKIYYLIYLIHVPGMNGLQNHLLFDMNKLLNTVISTLPEEEIYGFTDNLFRQFASLKADLAGTILDCQNTIGKEIARTENPRLISYYIRKLVEFGFVYPGTVRINEDWQTEVNRHHVKNIRIWLDLIRNSPDQYKDLLGALIVNLKLGGIFVSDTDLLQRDVTRLLNADIAPVYRQVKQLARIFPVYFREIGAEGKLRDVTTAMDELCKRKDRLVHFLRKQVHSESNNTHIRLTEQIARYWDSANRDHILPHLPKDVADTLDERNPLFVGMKEIMEAMKTQFETDALGVLHLNETWASEYLLGNGAFPEADKKKFLYLIQLYHLLLEKYSFETKDISRILAGSTVITAEEGEQLEEMMEQGQKIPVLEKVYEWMGRLKDQILDPQPTEAVENIYYKRHIAVGIPSMYGQYSEPKFEALGLMYRLERVAAKWMVMIVHDCQPDYLTTHTLTQAYRILELFLEGLKLDGVENQSFQANLEMLRYCLSSQSFSLDQYIDVFRFMATSVKEIINEYFLRVYDETLSAVVPQIVAGSEQDHVKVTESFYRDILSSAFLIQELDSFVTDLTDRLTEITEKHPPQIIKDMLTYDPAQLMNPFHQPCRELDNQVFMGAKAYYLKRITEMGFPVPEGFVITTELFRHRKAAYILDNMRRRIEQDIYGAIEAIEQSSGRKFGDPSRPLLLSVRSGTAISMPGAMSTFLNVGINEEIAGWDVKNPDTAWMNWDAYRRFLQSWGMAMGIARDDFDRIMIQFKQKYGVDQKMLFSWEQMRDMAAAYRHRIEEAGIEIPHDPEHQLIRTIRSVLDSWDSRRARTYRRHLRIADEWGTAVIIQRMVMGNRSKQAGSGVFFTHNPKINRPGIHPYGDFTLCSQGEDIVSGLVYPLPISESQRKDDYSDSSLSLQTAYPAIYERLMHYAHRLIDQHGFNHQEIEFTFESENPDDLYILQIRDQNIQGAAAQMRFAAPPGIENLLGRGIGIFGGCLSGRVVFSEEDMARFRHHELKIPLILIRPDTVPDDIPMIFKSDALLTSRGGVTSHAAVTAAKLGKVCIVNCRDLYVNEMQREAQIHGIRIQPGDYISLDGQSGNIYKGWNPVTEKDTAGI